MIERAFDTLGVMSPRVIVPMLNVLADLHAWGRSDGSWWALVSWTLYGNTPTGNAYRYLSAWVSASEVEPSRDPAMGLLYRQVERLDLDADPSTWPTPAASPGRTWQHYGAITAPPAPAQSISTIPQPPSVTTTR